MKDFKVEYTRISFDITDQVDYMHIVKLDNGVESERKTFDKNVLRLRIIVDYNTKGAVTGIILRTHTNNFIKNDFIVMADNNVYVNNDQLNDLMDVITDNVLSIDPSFKNNIDRREHGIH